MLSSPSYLTMLFTNFFFFFKGILPCSICWLYFMRVATVRPEKQQSIKFGFNVSKLGFAFWKNSKYTSTNLGKEPNKSVLCPCHRMRKRVLRWKVPASTFAASLGNALPRTWSLTARAQAGLHGSSPTGDCFILAF